MIVRGYRENEAGQSVLTDIIDINEITYSGKDMGERRLTATVNFPTPIDFRIGDYVEVDIANLLVGESNRPAGGHGVEKFYLYTVPSIKKIASPMMAGNAFEHTIIFYPRQYELGCILMRDVLQENTANGIVYTGYNDFSFYGGAARLAQRIQYVLDSFMEETENPDRWIIHVADIVDEFKNSALEQFQFTFSSNSVMDALVMLTNEDNVNTTFFCFEREIWIGYKRPTVCSIDEANTPSNRPYIFKYGKTSHRKYTFGEGGLFNIAKTVGNQMPVTKLYVYGGSKNLNRFYCSDRYDTGRYVNKLMLPSFSADGKTDFLISREGIKKFGIREGVKTFEDIYPSIRNITYGDIRKIKYVIKLQTNGSDPDFDEMDAEHVYDRSNSTNPIARLQCYRVEKFGPVNRLVESYPPKDLAIFVHALSNSSKRVMCVLHSSQSAQSAADGGNLPKRNGVVIPGSCFAVHDGIIGNKTNGYENLHQPVVTTSRTQWFTNILDESKRAELRNEAELFQINYGDDARITDVFEFTSYNQKAFSREGYSAYCYPRVNEDYPCSASPKTLVDEVVRVDQMKRVDTYRTLGTRDEATTFQIYIRDIGFKINEQTPFGYNAHLINGEFTINFRDGFLGGLDFTVSAQNGSEYDENVVPAYFSNGQFNPKFVSEADNKELAEEALANGAFWRINVNRNDEQMDSYGEILPNWRINAHSGDRFIFTNICMPDIYIYAAENRMKREAEKYLNDNDNCGVDYHIETDKVRFQQVPALALQMREGVTIRMEDEDLQIATDNEEKELVDGVYQEPYVQLMYEPVVSETYIPSSMKEGMNGKTVFVMDELHDRNATLYYSTGTAYIPLQNKKVSNIRIKFNSQYRLPFKYNEVPQNKPYKGYMNFIVTAQEDVNDTNNFFSQSATTKITKLTIVLEEKNLLHITEKDGAIVNTTAKFGQKGSTEESFGFPFGRMTNNTEDAEVTILEQHDVTETGGRTSSVFDKNVLISHRTDKYYTAVIDLPASGVMNTVLYNPVSKNYKLCLYAGVGEALTKFFPDAEIVETQEEPSKNNYVRYRFSFYIPTNFNDSVDYYTGFEVVGNGDSEHASFGLQSIVEKNTTADGNYIQHVDLVLDEITIKYTNSVTIGTGDKNTKEDIFREISATVKEQQRASAWTTIMNKIETVQKQEDQTGETLESLSVQARRRFRNLDELRESIFDPDGTITDVFLQTMMFQIGADSMNYALDNTRIFNGMMRNVSFHAEDNDDPDTIWFLEIGKDTLRHYVYTDGTQAGNWNIAPMSDALELDAHKTYYIAAKCNRSSTSAEWVVSETAHSVDEDPSYWYFNYGIVLSGDNTARTIMETRGNAYMYGDNIICGKISTQDGQSYIDLSGNEVKFGSGLEYKGGMLKVGDTFETNGSGVAVKGVLSMKNQSNVVQSGISGKSDDNILIWGGGTYANALWAKDHNYKIEARNPAEIMTLIKRDGTGKIGIFRILQNSVQVFDENGDLKVEITNDELGNVIPSRTQWFLNKSNIYAPLIKSGTNLIVDSSPVCKSNGTIMISYVKVSVSNVKVMNASGTAVAGSVYFNINAMNNNQVKLGELGGISQISVTSAGGGSGSSTLERTFIYETIRNMTYSITIEPVVTGGTQVSFYYTIYVESFFAENYSPRTIIAKDGLASIADGNHYFVVKNSNRHQQVIMHGLPSWADGTDEGGLYRRPDGTIAIAQYH